MEYESLYWILGVTFFAGAIDSIAGGGGLITLPSLLFAGVPSHIALGTNKFAGAIGGVVALGNFARKKLIEWPLVLIGGPFSLIGSWLGSRLVVSLQADWLEWIVLAMIPIAAISLVIKREDSESNIPNSKRRIPMIGFVMGAYDGFFGPGTGTFLIIGIHHFLGYSLVRSTALAKPFNSLSSLVALTNFLVFGKVAFGYAIPMACASMLGNWAGSQLALQQGALLVRKALFTVCIVLFISLAIRISIS